jgi:hypothetical protein
MIFPELPAPGTPCKQFLNPITNTVLIVRRVFHTKEHEWFTSLAEATHLSQGLRKNIDLQAA